MTAPSDRNHRWDFRTAREGDIDSLVALHARVFPRPISPEHWMWKLRRPSCPNGNVWVAEADGRIVFQYAGIPVRFRHAGVDRWAMIDVDTMTHPDYRRRGLLTQGGAHVYEHWKSGGVAFTVGLPNEQWGSRTGALGWKRVGSLRWWVRWLDPLRLLGAKAGWPRPRSGSTPRERREGRFRWAPMDDPAPFDALWQRIGEEGVVRDSTWFRWRYLEAIPRWTLVGAWEGDRLVGGAAFRLDSDRDCPSGLIGEVMTSDFNVARLLVRHSSVALRTMGAVRAAILISPGSMLEEAALASGFLPRPAAFSVDAVDLGGGLPRAARFQGGDFDAV